MTGKTEPRWAVRIGCLAVAVGLLALGLAVRHPPTPPLRRIVASVGSSIYQLDVAETPEQRSHGLQDVTEPPGSAGGMLFVFDPPQTVTMAVKTLPYPVDVAFVDEDLRISRTVSIQPEPQGIQLAPSGRRVRYAIEVRAGTLAARDIVEGDVFQVLQAE